MSLSDDIWLSIDHNDTVAMERGCKFKSIYNGKMQAFDSLSSEISELVQNFTHVNLQSKESDGSVGDTDNERLVQELRSDEPHSLYENFTFKRPHGFILKGTAITRSKEINALVDEFLMDQYPKEFQGSSTGTFKYRPNKIAEMLADPDVVLNLSDNDKVALQTIYPNLLDEMTFSLKSAPKVKIVSDGIKNSKKVYLEKTIAEFEKKLSGSSSENVWQKFLHDHILTLLNTYAHVIEKQSVELDGKYPDFMLIDAYGYLDVYEIKKPQTTLLKFDKSRKNYYWDAELARAITQTEKYMSSVQKNRFELENKFRKSDVDAHIVRPRGFVIVGKRADLKTEGMQEDFRILNDSLKNIDIICFDDLLDNLKALLDRLTN